MVALRLIPCLDVADGRVVKGVNFVALRDAGDPVKLACSYSQAGADELVFLDIAAIRHYAVTLFRARGPLGPRTHPHTPSIR